METPQVYSRSDDFNSQEKQDTKLVIIFLRGLACACVHVCTCVCVYVDGAPIPWAGDALRPGDRTQGGKLNQGCETARTSCVSVDLK